MLAIWLLLAGGLTLLVIGGDLLVRGAVRMAERLGISPLVIGLTLVGFGTSMPELVTSVQAALSGAPGIAWGNIVGSNIANILLIGGVSAILFPIVVTAPALRRDAVVMLAVATVFTALAALVPMARAVGAAFVLTLAAYVILTIRNDRAATAGALHDKEVAATALDPGLTPVSARPGGLLVPLLLALGGLALVIGGGAALVRGAVALAQSFAIPETVIGLTIVAVGTSMPELVTSVMAAIRRQGDVAFGNIVGSNIVNILGIGGMTALIAPIPMPATIVGFDAPVMLAVTVLMVLAASTGLRVSRREGAVLLAGYVAYLAVLWP
ncbi:calcium/sodium antiporter [Roseovarius ramblicola]|uniref:Calcium/sodium antiporter n=1 Tax=Roseovarius ramblicola TaxID=2022336 RepID=A0ABV5HX76_9RHOB